MRWLNQLTHRTVIVHTAEGDSFRGVLTGVFRDCLVLIHAYYMATEGDTTIDGEVVIPRPHVAWMQVVNGDSE